MVAGGPTVLGFVNIIFSLYLSRRHLDAMKESLKNSRYIYIWGPSLGKRGLICSAWEVMTIAGLVIWPKAHIRVGDVDPVDVENFPPHLKRLLIAKVAMAIITLAWAAIVALLIKLR